MVMFRKKYWQWVWTRLGFGFLSLAVGLILVLAIELHHGGAEQNMTGSAVLGALPSISVDPATKETLSTWQIKELDLAAQGGTPAVKILLKVLEHLGVAFIIFGMWHVGSEAMAKFFDDNEFELIVDAALSKKLVADADSVRRACLSAQASQVDATNHGITQLVGDWNLTELRSKVLQAKEVKILAGSGGYVICKLLSATLKSRLSMGPGTTKIALVNPSADFIDTWQKKEPGKEYKKEISDTIAAIKRWNGASGHDLQLKGYEWLPNYQLIIADDFVMCTPHFITETSAHHFPSFVCDPNNRALLQPLLTDFDEVFNTGIAL
jgi:hypothetical protein